MKSVTSKILATLSMAILLCVGVAATFLETAADMPVIFGASFGLLVLAKIAHTLWEIVPAGILAAAFIDASTEYHGQQNEDIFFREGVKNKLRDESGIRLVITKKKSVNLMYLAQISKVVMPYTRGWQGGRAALFKKRKMTLEDFKAEQAHDKHDYKDMVLETMAGMADQHKTMNDMTGTDVHDAQVKVWNDGLGDDLHRIFWLADTTKTHASAGDYPDGTSYLAGDPDEYYNVIDGVLKSIDACGDTSPNADQCKRIDIPAGALAQDYAQTLWKNMYDNSPRTVKRLKGRGKMVIYATESLIENYRDTLETDGSEQARTMLENGKENLTWRGVPIRLIDIEHHIEDDFAAAFSRHWCIMSTPDNLCLVANVSDDFAETKFWFNPDENENRQRAQFRMGADFVLPELVTYARQ